MQHAFFFTQCYCHFSYQNSFVAPGEFEYLRLQTPDVDQLECGQKNVSSSASNHTNYSILYLCLVLYVTWKLD